MFCSKCGKKVEKGVKFCPSCGEKVVESKVEEKKEEVKKEVVKVEPVKKAEPTGSNGLGIAGMVIGIVSIVLSFVLSIIIILFPVVGLILSLCSKGKKGIKIAGIITNAVGIVLSISVFIFYMVSFGTALGTFVDEEAPKIEQGIKTVEKTVKSGYPYGTWTCVSYYSTEATNYSDDVTKAPSDSKTVLNLYTDNTFRYGPYSESYKNYYKGTFTYTIETDKNQQYKDKGESFIDIKGTITDAMIDGVKADDKTNMNLEMGLIEADNYDTAAILFYSSYNTYYCQR